jgi:hypothetical protein
MSDQYMYVWDDSKNFGLLCFYVSVLEGSKTADPLGSV